MLLELDAKGYESDDTVKGLLLPGNERQGLIRKPSQVDIFVHKNSN